jgi:hemerythrin-like domain-containing protein
MGRSVRLLPSALPEGEDRRLCGDGVEMIAAAHLDHRQLLLDLDALLAQPCPDAGAVARLARALPEAVTLHRVDEEEDLLPLLRRRAGRDDDLPATLARLSREHAALGATAEVARAALDRLGAGHAAAVDRAALSVFATVTRRHVLFENAVVLPLARVRLKPADRRALAERMAARRGLCLLPEGWNRPAGGA